ncbi:MAG: zinc ribbon domain-containing protein [Oscillospiraceae bacterium]|nr:zinc ribbon domain-containing protein [Oscillospiraceae bacterium]
MFCKRCGTQNPDNANFCQGCGLPLKEVSQENSANSYQSPPNTNPAPNPNPTVYSEPAPESPLAALKKVATSGLFRFTAFAFCTLIISNILTLIDTSFMWGLVSQILGDIDRSLVNDMSRYLASISSFGAIISQIPYILIAIGLWMTYATAASKKDKPFSTAGLTLIKVIYVIELVMVCLLLAVCMVVMLIASITSTNAEDAMLVFAFVIALDVVFGVAIFWLAMIIKSLNAAKKAATEEHGKHVGKNASAFVGVVCYIGGVINIISAISNLVVLSTSISDNSAIIISTGSITAFCNCAIGAVVQICFGVLIFRFRREMKRLK